MEIRISLAGETVTPELADLFTGVGLVRGEFFFRKHGAYSTSSAPLSDIHQYLTRIAAIFPQGEIWYRLSDFWSDEANVLEGNTVVVEEQNPLVGLRGVRRYFADKKHFCEELCVVKDVANVNDNVKLLVPFVQDAREFTKVFQMCKEAGWKGEIGSMIEIPSALLTAKEFVQAGATNLFVGLNDLTSLFLGRDRGDPSLKLHPALWHQISALSEAIGPSAKWGIGGNMSSEIVKTARASGAGYVSMHYDEVSKLMGIDPARTPDIGLVRTIKDHTNKLKKAYALQATHS